MADLEGPDDENSEEGVTNNLCSYVHDICGGKGPSVKANKALNPSALDLLPHIVRPSLQGSDVSSIDGGTGGSAARDGRFSLSSVRGTEQHENTAIEVEYVELPKPPSHDPIKSSDSGDMAGMNANSFSNLGKTRSSTPVQNNLSRSRVGNEPASPSRGRGKALLSGLGDRFRRKSKERGEGAGKKREGGDQMTPPPIDSLPESPPRLVDAGHADADGGGGVEGESSLLSSSPAVKKMSENEELTAIPPRPPSTVAVSTSLDGGSEQERNLTPHGRETLLATQAGADRGDGGGDIIGHHETSPAVGITIAPHAHPSYAAHTAAALLSGDEPVSRSHRRGNSGHPRSSPPAVSDPGYFRHSYDIPDLGEAALALATSTDKGPQYRRTLQKPVPSDPGYYRKKNAGRGGGFDGDGNDFLSLSSTSGGISPAASAVKDRNDSLRRGTEEAAAMAGALAHVPQPSRSDEGNEVEALSFEKSEGGEHIAAVAPSRIVSDPGYHHYNLVAAAVGKAAVDRSGGVYSEGINRYNLSLKGSSGDRPLSPGVNHYLTSPMTRGGCPLQPEPAVAAVSAFLADVRLPGMNDLETQQSPTGRGVDDQPALTSDIHSTNPQENTIIEVQFANPETSPAASSAVGGRMDTSAGESISATSHR